MPRPISYAVFCLKKKKQRLREQPEPQIAEGSALAHYNLGLTFRKKGYDVDVQHESRLALVLVLFQCYGLHPDLHSFPTRRSSDLIAGGIASALAGGAMSKLFGGGQKAASGGIQGDVLSTDNNTVGMGDAGIKSAIQGSNVPNPDEAVPSFVSGAMAKAGKGLL